MKVTPANHACTSTNTTYTPRQAPPIFARCCHLRHGSRNSSSYVNSSFFSTSFSFNLQIVSYRRGDKCWKEVKTLNVVKRFNDRRALCERRWFNIDLCAWSPSRERVSRKIYNLVNDDVLYHGLFYGRANVDVCSNYKSFARFSWRSRLDRSTVLCRAAG